MNNRRRDAETRRRGGKTPTRRVFASTRFPLITLLTDFGTEDYFVAAVKGVFLSSSPQARIVDITHDVPPQDVEAAAFTLLAVYSWFPPDTIHVTVVDPGVGSPRRPILVQAGRHYFVGPDNGVFSYVCEREENGGDAPRIFHLTNTKYFHHPVSSTFNGRDVFAPIAGALAQGVKPAALGDKITDIIRLPSLRPEIAMDGTIKARIIHIDRFGNCVTNITQSELTDQMITSGARIQVGGKFVKSFRRFFAEEIGTGDKVFGIWGSAGFLELAAANASAAKLWKIKRGDQVIVSTS